MAVTGTPPSPGATIEDAATWLANVPSATYSLSGPYSNTHVVGEANGFTVACSAALVLVTSLAHSASTTTAGGVVNVASSLCTVPFELVAVSRKWYVVSGTRPVRAALTGSDSNSNTGRVCVRVDLPYAVVGPYSKK